MDSPFDVATTRKMLLKARLIERYGEPKEPGYMASRLIGKDYGKNPETT